MKLDLADIAGTPGARGRYAVSECLDREEAFSLVGPVTGEITVENTGPLLLVRGKLKGVLKLACVRCLSAREQPFEIEVEEEFATEDTASDVATIDRDEPEVAAIVDYVLDVRELARQQTALAVPMAFVCHPDCPGLCPTCGKRLADGGCECGPQPVDDRWTRLRDLLGEAKDSLP